MPRPDFRSLFCQRFQCAPSDYEEMALRKCLTFHARLLAPLIRRFRPDFFKEDFRFLEFLGRSRTSHEVNTDVLNFSDLNRGSRRFWRTRMRLRVSGRKAARLAYRLLAEARLEADKILK